MAKAILSKIQCLLVSLAVWAVTSAGAAQTPIVIKFSHVVTPDTPKGQAAAYFKKLAEERTRGRVRVEIYPDGKLLNDQVELAALQLGAVQMIAPSLSKLGRLGVKEFEVFDLPFLFSDETQFHQVINGTIGHALLQALENKGVLGLAFWDNGFKQISANRPVRLPSDLAGVRMRIQPSRVISSQMRALGAIPQPMAFNDTYSALRAGVVDGAENPISNIYTQHMHEVQKYITLSNHGYLGYLVMVNKKFWEELPADLQRTLAGAMKDATQFANDIAQRNNAEALDAIQRSGKVTIITLTPAEKEQWARTLATVHRESARFLGQPLLESIYQETGFNPAKP